MLRALPTDSCGGRDWIFRALFRTRRRLACWSWWATKLGPRGSGLLNELQPPFGTVYGIVFAGLMAAILVNSRRWKGLLVMGLVYFFMALIETMPTSAVLVPAIWDEYWALVAMFSSLVIAMCLHYEWLD